MPLILSEGVMQDIVAHARRDSPLEACGLLAGTKPVAGRYIAMRNTLSSATAYEMDPAELASRIRELREIQLDLLGIVHSHPRGPAEPSPTDLAQAYYPEAAYVIVSLSKPELPVVRAFRILDGSATEIELHAIV